MSTQSKLGHCLAQESMEKRLTCLADAGPEALTERLRQIEREWSSGRMTKAVSGVVILVGLALTPVLGGMWWIVPTVGALLLMQYLFTRRSLLGGFFHAIGFRTGEEIDQEKFALKALRGDFRNLPTITEVENKDDIARLEGEGGIALDPETAKPDAKDVVRDALDAARS